MKIKRFVICEEKQGLFFSRRMLYGYTLQNQLVYKVCFDKNLHLARKFYSEQDANKLLDELPPNEYMLSLCRSNCKSQIKLANLIVMPISIVYDS